MFKNEGQPRIQRMVTREKQRVWVPFSLEQDSKRIDLESVKVSILDDAAGTLLALETYAGFKRILPSEWNAEKYSSQQSRVLDAHGEQIARRYSNKDTGVYQDMASLQRLDPIRFRALWHAQQWNPQAITESFLFVHSYNWLHICQLASLLQLRDPDTHAPLLSAEIARKKSGWNDEGRQDALRHLHECFAGSNQLLAAKNTVAYYELDPEWTIKELLPLFATTEICQKLHEVVSDVRKKQIWMAYFGRAYILERISGLVEKHVAFNVEQAHVPTPRAI